MEFHKIWESFFSSQLKKYTYGKEINPVRKPLNSIEVPQKIVTGKPKTWSSTYIIFFLYLTGSITTDD